MVKKKLIKPNLLKQPSKPICYSLYISSKHVPITDKTKAPLILYDYYYEKNDNGSYCIYNKNNVKLNIEYYNSENYDKMIPDFMMKSRKINIENTIQLSLKNAISLIERFKALNI